MCGGTDHNHGMTQTTEQTKTATKPNFVVEVEETPAVPECEETTETVNS